MRILVTGATGFLGTRLCAALEAKGYQIVAVNSKSCDLTKQGSLARFDDQSFDQIYHLAAWTQAGEFCLHHPAEQWVINQQINTNVLTWWQQKQPQAKFISIGTSCAYDPKLELVEENYLLGCPIDSLYVYGMTKRMLYVGQRAMHRQYGLSYLTLVPNTLFGPHYHTDGRQMHFIFDIIRKILRGKYLGETVVLWGDGEQCRELVYLDDFVENAVELAAAYENDLVNVGSGREYSIRWYAQQICNGVDYPFERIVFDRDKYVGTKSKCLLVGKLRQLRPGYVPTPIEEGLGRTIQWCQDEYVKGNIS